MKLYFNPKSRATITKWMLDECGVEYEIVPIDLEKRENKQPAFLAVNPAGKLPALVDGDQRLFENAAICLYLSDKFPAARLGPRIDEPQRGRFLSLLVYSTAQLEPAMGDHMQKLETAPWRGWTRWEEAQQVVIRELGAGPYLFGDWFTAADVMIGSMFMWKRRFGGPKEPDAIEAYVDRLLAREAAAPLRP